MDTPSPSLSTCDPCGAVEANQDGELPLMLKHRGPLPPMWAFLEIYNSAGNMTRMKACLSCLQKIYAMRRNAAPPPAAGDA